MMSANVRVEVYDDDYVERSLEAITRLEAQFQPRESGTSSNNIADGHHPGLLFLSQLGETKRILNGLYKPTLEGHKAVHRELHRAVIQTETSVKEWWNPGHHNDEPVPGKRREHFLEILLALRWWTMVTALQAGEKYSFHGNIPFMERKGESQVNSQSPPISSYGRHLPSLGFEIWLQKSESRHLDGILQWKIEFGNILGKDESYANVALEAIRSADFPVFVIEGMPASYVDEAKSALIEEEITLDLTRDVLGVSRTGSWVIRTKCQGVDCALKRVTDGSSDQPVLARLSHPHIVQLMHYWRKDEYLFLVMELMEGDLTDLLSRHKRANDTRLSVPLAVDIMLQTAKAMLYLHDLDITYPHLSCSNVLFRKSGISQDGSIEYVIKLSGVRYYTLGAFSEKKQDVYRFGLFCLEVLTERQQCEDPLDMAADTRPSIPETIPPILRFCISSCFESNFQLGFAQVVTLLLLAQCQILKSQENEAFLSFGTCEDLDLVQLNQHDSESPSTSDADLEKYPVHQLYPEPDVAGSDSYPSATLIFFHGFAKSPDEWKSTWMTRNREHVWPQAWLPKDLPGNVRILSLSYDIDAPGESQDIGAIKIGKNALRQLVLSSKWKLADPEVKVILIGHSFGGLVIKSLVVEAHNLAFVSSKAKAEDPLVLKCPSFLENLKGIVFYSVPGSTTQDQQFEQYIVKLNQTGVLQRSSLMQALLKDTRLFNQQMLSLCSQFEEIVPEKTQILIFIEGKGMRRIREKQVVVSEASARAQMQKAEFNIVEEDNHFEVCRPVSADHKGYNILVDFLKDKLKIGWLDFGAKKINHRGFEDVLNMHRSSFHVNIEKEDVPDICEPEWPFILDEFVQSENIPTREPQDVPKGSQLLPPGFRFHPTDVELVAYYLKEKINGRPIEMSPIAVVDLYKCEPWDLPDKSLLGSHDQEWYFYSIRDRKGLNNSRTNRATENGYWKSTGKDRIVRSTRSSGFKKTLLYYKGRAPRGERTDWVMHEFRMEDEVYKNLRERQEPYVLVRLFKKGAAAPVVEKPYSLPLRVEEGETDDDSIFAKYRARTSAAMVDAWPDLARFGKNTKSGDDTSTMQEIVDTVQGQPPDASWDNLFSPWFPLEPEQTQAEAEAKVEPKLEIDIAGGGYDPWEEAYLKANLPVMGSIDANVDKQGQSSEGIHVFRRRKRKKSSEDSKLERKSKAGAEAGDGSLESNAEISESPGLWTMSPETRAALPSALKEIFAGHHVCCMETIVQSLREMAFKRTVANSDPETAAVAVAAAEASNAPAVELIGAVNKVATRFGGVYILNSLGDPTLDPFRDVVIGLLRKMGPQNGLRKTEIMSAFKIATGRDVPSTTYQKVMKELCYTRGGAWVLKSGDGRPS